MIAKEVKMSFTEKKEKENLIERVLLKYRDKLSDVEKGRFRDYINTRFESYAEVEAVLRDLFVLDENGFMQKMKEFGIVMSVDPSNSIEEVVVEEDTKIVDTPLIEPVQLNTEEFVVDASYDDFNTMINQEKFVDSNSVFDQTSSYTVELPNASTINPNEVMSEKELDTIKQDIIRNNQANSVLPTTVGGYINITLLVIILNAVGGLILWLMLNLFYSAML